MNKTVLLILLFLNLYEAAVSQVTVFQKAFGGNDSDQALASQQTSDGGYIVSGTTKNYGAGGIDVLLVKLDITGNIQWSKTFGGNDEDIGKCVQQTSDGGYIITGYTMSFGGDRALFLIKTDGTGVLLWFKTYGGANEDEGYFVQQTSDGGYIVTGFTKSFGAGSEDIYLIKTDGNGTLQWSRAIGGSNNERGSAVQQLSAGGYIITGFTNSFGVGSNDIFLVKTDGTGNFLWSKTYGGSNTEFGESVQQIPGGFIITGYTNSFGAGNNDIYLLKTDTNGALLWSKTYGGTNDDKGYSVKQTNNGEYIVSGLTRSFGFGSDDIYVIKTDGSGNNQWSKVFGGANDDRAYSIQQTNDGGYSISGQTKSFGAGNEDICLIKTNSSGTSGCNEASVLSTVNTPSPTFGNFIPTLTSGGVMATPVCLITNPSVFTTLLCQCAVTATISGDTDICPGDNTVLTAAGGSTYLWSNGSTTSGITVSPANTTSYSVTVSTGLCSDTQTVVVTVNPIPASPTASGTSICSGSTAALTATAPGGTYQWYNAPSNGTLLGTGANYNTPVLNSSNTYYVQTSISGCISARTAVTVTVNPIPAAPTVSATTICAGNTATLSATAPGGTYEWYNTAIAGTLLQTGANYTTPALNTSTTFYVQTTVLACTSPRTAVGVTASPIPAAPTASATPICAGSAGTLNATAPGGTYGWYNAPVGGTLLGTGAGYITPVLTATTTYYIQTTVSGCASPRVAVTVTVSPIPSAPTSSGTSICEGSSTTLSATAPGGTYAWYNAAAGGTLLQTAASYTTPILSTSTTYYVQTSVSGCISPRTAVTVTVNPAPAAPTVANTTICAGSTVALTATAPGGTYEWYNVPAGGTLLVTGAVYTTPVLNITTSYYVQTTVLGCTSPRTTVTVTVNPIPANPTASNITLCSGSTATITASAPGGTYGWYNAPVAGVLLQTGISYTTPVLSVTTTYYVQTTIAGCSSSRTAVTVTVNPVPAAPTASGTSVCQGNTATLTTTAPGGTYQWYDAAVAGTLLQTGSSYTTPVLNVTTAYYVQTTLSACSSSRTAVTVTVNPIPAAPTASGATICAGNATALLATAPGGTYDWYNASSGGTFLATGATFITPALNTSAIYYVQTIVSACASPRTAVSVTVNPIPTAPNASGTTICAGNTATITATAPGGTYSWYDAPSAGTLLQTGVNYTTAILNTTSTYYVQTTVANCISPRTTVTVTVNAIPASPTASNSTLCSGSTTNLVATLPGGTYEWYDAAVAGTLLQTGSNYTTPALTSATTYYVQTTVLGCISARTAVTVTVNPVPSAPAALGISICGGSTTILTATAPGGAYEWYNAAAAGTLLQTAASYTTPVLNVSTSYYVQTTISGCTSIRTAVTVTVNAVPAAPTSPGVAICEGNTALLAATAPGGAYQWYNAAMGGTLLGSGASYTTPVLNASTTYFVQTTVSGCTSARKAVTATVNPIPSAPTASGTSICAGSTATLTATAPGGTYQWYDAATSGTLLQTGISYTTPVLTGTTTYYIQTNSSGCVSARTGVMITVNPSPSAPSSTSATICSGNNVTLIATAPGGNYEWYATATGGVLLQTGANYTTPVLTATITYYVQTTALGCTSTRSPVMVTVNSIPAAPTASGTTICSGNTTTLFASAPGGAYEWYNAAAGGTLLQTGASYTTPVLFSTTTYYVQTIVAGCTSPRTLVTATIDSIPSSPEVFNAQICAGSTATLTATAPGGTYRWYDSPAGGTLLQTGANYTSPVLTASINYFVQTTLSTGCVSPRVPVTVTVNSIPAAPTAPGATICSGSTATLTATAPGGTYDWYDAPTTGTFLGTGASYTTPVLTAGTTYYIQTMVSGCTSVRTAVTVTLNEIPVSPTVTGITQCAGNTATLTATAPGGTYQWYDAPSGGILLQTGASYTTPVLNVTTAYYAQTTVFGCISARTTVTVTVNPVPVAPTASDTAICTGNIAFLTATNPGGAYQWYDAAVGGTLLGNGANYTSPALTVNTAYYVQTTVSGCTSARKTVTVTVNPIPSMPTAPGISICSGNSASLLATAPGGTYQWYDAAGGGTLLGTGANYITPVLTTGTTYYVQTTVLGCASARTAVTVTVNLTPPSPTASGTTLCSGSIAILTASAPGGAYGWYDAPLAGTLLQTGSNYTTPALYTTITYYVQTTILGCTSARAGVTVTVNPIPSAPSVSNTSTCAGSAVTITATAPGGIYQWYDNAAGGTLLQTGGSYTSPALNINTTYYIQTTVAGCTSSRTPVTVTINTIPAAPAAADTTVCAGNPVVLSATAPGGAYQWYEAPAGGTILGTGANYTSAVLNVSTTYYVQTTVSGCASPRKAVVVTVKPVPAAPDASGASICSGNTVTLLATAPGGTYEWYDAPAGGVLLQTGVNYTTPVLNATITYYLQTTVSGCISSRVPVTVTANPIPAPPSVSDITICSGSTAPLTATAPGGTYEWYDAPGGTLLQTGTSYTSPALTANTSYYVHTTVSGCTGPETMVTVSVNTIPPAPTASGTTICAGSTATVTATAPGGTYDWYDTPTNGTFLGTGANYTTPVLTTSTTYYIQTTVSGCASVRTATTVTVNPIPASPTAPGTAVCSGTTAALAATAPGGAYEWYDAPIAGVLLQTGANYTSTALATTTYHVQTTISGCTSPRTTVTVTVNSIPASPSIPDTTICSGSSVTLTPTAPGGTYQWYDAPAGGTILQTGSSYTTPALSTDTIYYIQTTVSGCTGPRISVNVSINPVPVAPTANGTTICAGNTAALTATAPGGSYEWFDAPAGGILQGTGANYTTTVLNAGSTYYVQTTISACASARTPVTVTVNSTPAPSVSGTLICAGNTATLTAPAGGSYEWYDASTAGVLLQTGASYTTPALNDTTTYYVQAILAGCASIRTAALVAVNPTPAPPTVAGATICSGSTITLSATAPGGTYEWFDLPVAGSLLQSGANYITPVLTAGTTYYLQTTVLGCTSARAAVPVTVNSLPTVLISPASSVICVGDSATLTATGANAYAWSPDVEINTTTGFMVVVSPAITITYTVVGTAGNGCSDTAAVTVTANSVPSLSVLPNSGNMCIGDSVALTANGANTYSWSPATGLNSITGTTVTAAPATSTTYTVAGTGANGCTNTAIVPVIINPITIADAGSDIFLCTNDSTDLIATGGTSYFWAPAIGLSNPGIANPTASPSVTTTYTVTVANGDCTDSDTVTVFINPLPVINAGPDVTVIYGFSTTLGATGGISYDWLPVANLSCSNCNNPVANPQNTTLYYVIGTNANGCSDTDSVTVTVDVECGEIYVANIFSPNNDGSNDILYVQNNCIGYMTFSIYDRWGEKVFETNDPKGGWDGTYKGKAMNNGAFVYVLNAKLINNKDVIQKGNIMLLR